MADDAANPPLEPPATLNAGRAGRPAPACPTCKTAMRFDGGKQIHDLWSEHFVCGTCGRETFRSYGRGSV